MRDETKCARIGCGTERRYHGPAYEANGGHAFVEPPAPAVAIATNCVYIKHSVRGKDETCGVTQTEHRYIEGHSFTTPSPPVADSLVNTACGPVHKDNLPVADSPKPVDAIRGCGHCGTPMSMKSSMASCERCQRLWNEAYAAGRQFEYDHAYEAGRRDGAQRWRAIAKRFARRAFNWRANFRSVGVDNAANISMRDRLRARLDDAHEALKEIRNIVAPWRGDSRAALIYAVADNALAASQPVGAGPDGGGGTKPPPCPYPAGFCNDATCANCGTAPR